MLHERTENLDHVLRLCHLLSKFEVTCDRVLCYLLYKRQVFMIFGKKKFKTLEIVSLSISLFPLNASFLAQKDPPLGEMSYSPKIRFLHHYVVYLVGKKYENIFKKCHCGNARSHQILQRWRQICTNIADVLKCRQLSSCFIGQLRFCKRINPCLIEALNFLNKFIFCPVAGSDHQ